LNCVTHNVTPRRYGVSNDDFKMNRNAIVGEHGKPELITPLSPSGDVANKKITISNKLKSQFADGEDGGRRRRGSGTSDNQRITVKGEVTDNTPLVVYLDGQVVKRR
jgi:hypothetical protein